MQLSDWVKNIVGKGENALFKLFLLFPQCFQKLSIVNVLSCQNEYLWSKGLTHYQMTNILDWSKLKQNAEDILTHSHTMTPFDAPGKQALWKHCWKRRNCSKRAISPFPTVFSTCLDSFLPFSSNLKLSSANSFSLEESKIRHLVMG